MGSSFKERAPDGITSQGRYTLECNSGLAFWRYSQLFTAGMCFLILFSMQSLRLNMSVAIVCMVNHTGLLEMQLEGSSSVENSSLFLHGDSQTYAFNSTTRESTSDVENHTPRSKREEFVSACIRGKRNRTEEKGEDGPFLWSKEEQGLVLNAFFWGYVVFMLPCAWVVNRFQSVRILGIATTLSSIFCLLTPLVASYGPTGVIVLRVLSGSLAGLCFPAAQNLLAKWLPPSKVAGLGSLAFTGATCGSIVTFIFSGYMCKYGFADGWQSVFYINGVFCLSIAMIWFVFVKEYPFSSPPRENSKASMLRHGTTEVKNQAVPWKSILTSRPVYAVIVCATAIDFYGTISALYLPTYFAEIMNFDITSNGVLSSLPYASKSLCQFSGGLLSDLLLKKTSLSVGALRKIIVSIGKIICAASIIIVGFMTCEQRSIAVVLMVSSMAAVGFMEMGAAINPIDIGGTYAGPILSIANFISNTIGLASASITIAITSENPTRESWQIIFIIAASIVLAALVIYVFCASGERQPWAGGQAAMEFQVPLNTHHNNDEGFDNSNGEDGALGDQGKEMSQLDVLRCTDRSPQYCV